MTCEWAFSLKNLNSFGFGPQLNLNHLGRIRLVQFIINKSQWISDLHLWYWYCNLNIQSELEWMTLKVGKSTQKWKRSSHEVELIFFLHIFYYNCKAITFQGTNLIILQQQTSSYKTTWLLFLIYRCEFHDKAWKHRDQRGFYFIL